MIERTHCLGTCPVYQLTIWKDGRISYTGAHHVNHTGQYSSRIPSEEAEKLFDLLEVLDVYSLDDYSFYGATDSPTAYVTIWDQGKFNQIHHYFGDSTAPPNLFTIEKLIDDAVAEHDLVYRSARTFAGEIDIIVSTEPVECGSLNQEQCYRYKVVEQLLWKKLSPELLIGASLEPNLEYVLKVEMAHIVLSPGGHSYDEFRILDVISQTAVSQ
ncbi:MAG: DUF6438 domain-containing protein [Chloroflexota bacterium]